MSRLAAFAALFPIAVAAPAPAQDSRTALTLSRVIQKLDLGTLSVLGEAAGDGETITFADYGYTDVEIADGTATVSAPDRVWVYTLRILPDGGDAGDGPAICLRVHENSRRSVQGAWRLSEGPDGYLRAARFNSAACPAMIVTGQRSQPRGFVIPPPRGPETPPRFIPEPYFPPDGPLFPRQEPYSPPQGPLRPLPQFPD